MKALEMLNKSFMKASLYYKSFIKALQKQLLVKVLCKEIMLGKHLDFFHESISFLEGKKLIHLFYNEINSLKIFRSLNFIPLIDQTKYKSILPF